MINVPKRSGYAVALCSSLPQTCARDSSIQVATLPDSVTTEQRMLEADIRTTRSLVRPSPEVL